MDRETFRIEAKMIALYMAATVILYCTFWSGWYSGLSYRLLLTAAAVMVISFGVLFYIYKQSTWTPMLSVMVITAGIGLSISAFFVATGITPSRFWGLCLIIMLAYKSAQAMLASTFKSKKVYYGFYSTFTVLEVIATVIVGFFAFLNGPLTWQVFFALVICFFYSCGQITLRKRREENFWKTAASAFVLGFVFIFAVILVLITTLVSEDGDGLEFLFDGFFAAVSEDGDRKSRKRKKKNQPQTAETAEELNAEDLDNLST